MECNVISNAVQPCLTRIGKFEGNMSGWTGKRLNIVNGISIDKGSVQNIRWRVFCAPTSLEEKFSTMPSNNFSIDEESDPDALPNEDFAKPQSSEELKSLLADAERSKLMKKLSEANQQNRFLKRQLQVKEEDIINFKSELAAMELEIQASVNLAKEIANYSIPEGSRKINGKYIQSYLLSRLQAVQDKLEEQIKDVVVAQSTEVLLIWCGVAESVQVMGSFDGWSEGEHLSSEYTGSYSTFSTTLMLRPGRYQIKFLVDGEWRLSPEYPTVGEGLMENNLLIVE